MARRANRGWMVRVLPWHHTDANTSPHGDTTTIEGVTDLNVSVPGLTWLRNVDIVFPKNTTGETTMTYVEINVRFYPPETPDEWRTVTLQVWPDGRIQVRS